MGRCRRVLLLGERERLADGHRAVEAVGEEDVQLLRVERGGSVTEAEARVAHVDNGSALGVRLRPVVLEHVAEHEIGDG